MMRIDAKSMVMLVVLVFASASPAMAYIGPGLGAGTIAVVFGVIVSIFLAIFAVIWYPLKRIFGKKGKAKSPGPTSQKSAENLSDSSQHNE